MKKPITLLFAGAVLFAGSNLYAQGKGDAAKGKEVFDQCSVCHNADSAEVKDWDQASKVFSRRRR